MNQPARLAVFISGNGSNAESIFRYFEHHPFIRVVLMLSNNPDAYGLKRAEKFNIPVRVFNKAEFREQDTVVKWLQEAGVTHIALAGFLWLIPVPLIRSYPHRIINIHPALLPKFGGKGMYGRKVHEAVKATGETHSGITIHEIDEKYDEGKILFQASIELSPLDTVEEIAEKIHQLEHQHYPRIIENWITHK
jgi:phosphoribosylglycinamide formyltransferase 1